ncbi:MAG: twin transmembrane helix small protein [Bacillati bacterium ANGP1]|uniref:Twin transmembrane helix small protein n=1 Tax=Candidatus Segetimicrobium genomatis TaxID=2569760 RepID=A0A537KAG6_9BACT|nr:MAG: twin transmembrane helix small protein [Terrabacteria group bacterium ANGP1]
MRSLISLLIFATLAAILASLGFGLFHLSRGGADDSRKMARALTVRITMSLMLFALLMLAWYLGLISPHALRSGSAPPHP